MNISMKLADRILKFSFDTLPINVVLKAKLCLLDYLGCAIGGAQTEIGKILIDLAEGMGQGNSTVVGCINRIFSANAAFINASLGNLLDFDDVYYGHPACTVIPVALAVGEEVKTTGKELVTAIVVGYEIHARIAPALEPPLLDRSRRILGLGSYQTFSSVAVASKLLRLDRNEIVNAIGIAGACAPMPSTMKTILNKYGVSTIKNNFCFAAHTGVMAALLAQRGYTGPPDIFEGDNGFWRMYGANRFYADKIKFGRKYRILDVAFKQYPAQRVIHPVIEAVLEITKDHKLDLNDINRITVETSSQVTLPPNLNKAPKTMLDAEFSVPYCVAMAVMGIEPGPKWFEKRMLNSQDVRNLTRKVEVISTKEADKIYNASGTLLATVIIEAKGKRYIKSIKYPKGSPPRPVNNSDVFKKFESLASRNSYDAKEIINVVNNLEKISDIKELTDLLKVRS